MDQEFDTVSGFLLKRTKDMVNKYRQLLVRETQVRRCRCCVSNMAFHWNAILKLQQQIWHQQTEQTVWAYELVSAAGESVSGDGDAGASLPSGWALRFGRGPTESPQGSRWASEPENPVITTMVITLDVYPGWCWLENVVREKRISDAVSKLI